MKVNKILLVGILLLAIITLGVVSASDDMDALAAIDDGDAVESPIDESEGIAVDDGDDIIGDGPEEKYNVTLDVNRPDEVYYNEEGEFSISVNPEDDECEYYPEGEVILYLNDEEIAREDVDYAWFEYTFDEFGEYNFKVKYTGDDNFNPAETSFTYNLTNSMYRISVNDMVIRYDRPVFTVYAPVLNPANIEITFNGKKLNRYYDDEYVDYLYNVSVLNYGLNTINIYYPGDEDFAEYSSNENVSVLSNIRLDDGDDVIVWGESLEIYSVLPKDATGTLKVYSVTYDDEYNNVFTEIGSADAKDGVAKVSINDLPVGDTEIYANFTGSLEVDDMWEGVFVKPLVSLPRAMLVGEDAYVDVKSSKDADFKVSVSYRFKDDYDNYEFTLLDSKDIVDGQAKISLSGLEKGDYELLVICESDYDLLSDDMYYLYVVDTYDVNLNITYCPENVLVDGGDGYVDFAIPEYADGNISLYIDGKQIYNIIAGDAYDFVFSSTGLSLGEHTLSVNFTSETQGISSDVAKFNVTPATIFIPDEMNINDRYHVSANSIEVRVNQNAKGRITILIDNKEFLVQNVDAVADEQHYYYFYDFADVSRGRHNVSVTYSDNKFGDVSSSKTVDFGYEISIGAEYFYGVDNLITVIVPNDLGNGELTITLDGNKMSYVRNSSEIIINPSKLSLGNHTVVVKYSGDDYYPAKEFNETFEVYAAIQYDYRDILIGSERNVYLILPDDAKGKLNVTVYTEMDDGENLYWGVYDSKLVSFTNGKASYSFADLPLGSYDVRVSYTEKDYEVNSEVWYFDVVSVDWGDDYLIVGQNKTISFISQDDEPGQLRVVLSRYVDDSKDWDDPVNIVESFYVPIVNSKANHTFTNLKIGTYHIFIAEEYIDGSLKGYQGGMDFYVEPPYVEVDNGKFPIGNLTPMVIDLPSDATGKVTLNVYANYSLDEPKLYKTAEFNVNGRTVIDLNDVIKDAGEFRIYVNYTGNYGEFESYYHRISAASVSKEDANLEVIVPQKANYGDVVAIDITINKNVTGTVTVNDKEITVTDGVAKYEIKDLNVGIYNFTVKFAGDNKFKADEKTVNVTVNKADSSVSVSDVVFDYGSSGSSDVVVSGATGFTAEVVGHSEAVVTVSDGVISVSNLTAGNYDLSVTTVVDANHNAVTKTANVTVNKADSAVIVSDVVFDYGSSGTSTVSFVNATGFTAEVVGHSEAVVTVSDGVVSVSNLTAGNYDLSVTTVVDANHNAVTKIAKITVNKLPSTVSASDIVFDYGFSGTTNAVFANASGVTASVVNHGEAIVSVNGNVINVSGLNAGQYQLRVTTITDANHYAVSKVVNITVNKLNTTLISTKVTTTYGTSKNLVATLKDANNKILVNKTVTVKLNNKVYKATTDDKGQVTFKVPSNLARKTHTATITFAGDDNYNAKSASQKVVVNKATSKLIVSNMKVKYSVKTKKYVVTVKTNKNKLLSGGKVTIKVNGKTYSANTNSKGQATLKITKLTNPKTYSATVKFVGNNNYKAASKTVKIIVTK